MKRSNGFAQNVVKLFVFIGRYAFLVGISGIKTKQPDHSLAYGDHDRHLEIIVLKSGNKITATDITIGGTGAALSWSNNGEMLASVQKGKVVVYSTDDLEIIMDIVLPPDFKDFLKLLKGHRQI